MRILLIVIWMMIPVGALAYHLGPGQAQVKLDQASQLLRSADAEAALENWQAAQDLYEEALAVLPESRIATNRRIRLERAKVMMMNEGLTQANADLEALVSEMVDDSNSDPVVTADAQSSLASSQFYRTWLMRLEGQPREIWTAQIESAEQTYRLLAERSNQLGNHAEFVTHTEDLESAIKLARMDLGELQGLPLPNQ